jgi:hypothetical protein
MARGLWLCIDSSAIRRIFAGLHPAPNSAHAASGRRAPVPATNGCGNWNVYVSRIDDQAFRASAERGTYRKTGGGQHIPKPRKIDTRCRHCNRRVRFTAERPTDVYERWDNRGRIRPVQWQPWPDHTDLPALIAECNVRNRGIQEERDKIGFVRAKNYRRE